MAGSLGDLYISLSADIAKLEAGLSRAEYLARQTSSKIEGAMSVATGAIAALGVGVSFGGLVAMVKTAIDAADAMEEMSQKTGLAVEQLSALDYAMRREGVATEQFGKAMRALSEKMIEAQDSTSKAGKLFGELGITAQDPREALLQLADVFARLPDGATKATLASTVFGEKVGSVMIPALNGGADGIRKLEAEAKRLGVTFNDETARAAAKFNDDLFALKEQSGALGRTLASQLLPNLSEITGAMKKAAEESGLLMAAWVGLGGIGDMIFNGTKAGQIKAEMASLTEQIEQLEAMQRQPNAIFGPMSQKRLDDYKAKLAELNKQLEDLQKGPAKSEASAADKKSEQRVAALLGGGDAGKKAADEAERLRQQGIKGWVAYADAVFAEADDMNRELAKSSQKFWDNEDKLREQGIKGWLDYIDAQIEAEEKAMREIADMQPSWLQAQEARWKPFMEGLDSGFRNTWDRIVDGGISSFGDFFRSIGESFKRMLADLVYQAALKPIFLNVVGGLGNMIPGLGGLTGAASSALGNGQTAGFGNLGNLFSGLTNLFKPGAAGGSGFMSNIMGSMGSNPLGWMAALSALSGAAGNRLFSGNRAAQTASYFGLGMGAIVNLLTGGSKENQNFRFMQGSGGEGLFGGFNAEGTYGFDLKALRGITGGLDARFLRLMGGNESGGTAALAAYTSANRRADGQPAQFAFPEGDQTAAEQIAKELLQGRYGTLFGLIDKSFAEQIKNFAGTSTELQALIESALGLFESLDGTKIKGLNIDSLRALAREGEELGATMDRVANDMAGINALFGNETDAYVQALGFVQSEFDALGVDMAINADSFKTLRDSLDLSTESGRAMFDMLVRVAPAMQQIEQAAAQMLNSFNGAMGQIFGSGFTRQIIEGQAAGLVSRFQSMSGLFGGMDPLSVFRGIGGANSGDIQYLYQTGGPELQSVLTEIISLYAQYAGLQEQVNTNTGNFSQAVTYASNAFDQLADARGGLRKWLDGLFLNDALTPLSPMQQLEESRRQYEQMLGLAQGGNVDAVAGLGNSAQTYLQIARDLFASSPAFNDIFRSVTTAVGGVAGVSSGDINARLATALPSNGTLATSADIQTLNSSILALVTIIGTGVSTRDPEAQQILRDIQTALNKSTAGALV